MSGPKEAVRADERFAALCTAFAGRAGVGIADNRGFARGGLTINGKLFAVRHKHGLLLKLPAKLVRALLDQNKGRPFSAGRPAALREWIIVSAEAEQDWLRLAEEALIFVKRVPALQIS